MPFPTSRTSPILIEREANLAVLNELASRAAAGHCQMALLTGEAGIGKSRIAREIARRCQARGFDTLIGKCSERDLDFPFAPFVDALRQRIATNGADPAAFLGPEAPGLAELLPEHRELGLSQPDTPGAENSPEHGKRRLFENLASLLRRLAEARPLLLLLEDLHWSDPTSVQLLELLPRRLERSPLLILGTCRDDEASQDVIRSLITLQRERTSRIISLAPLTEPGTCAMLEAILSEPPPRHLVTSLHDRTGGNPFLIEELLALAPEAGPWPRSGILVPATVREVVARQVDGLDDDAMRIAELTAIVGEPPLVHATDAWILGFRDHWVMREHGAPDALAELPDAHFVDDAGVRRNGPREVGRIAAEALAEHPGRFWLHVDLDVLAPAVMPAVDDLVPGGLDWDELTQLLRPMAQSEALLGLDVTIYDPSKDPGRVLAPRVVQLLADALGPDATP